MTRKRINISMDNNLLEALDMSVLLHRHFEDFKADMLKMKNAEEYEKYYENNRSAYIEIAVAQFLKKSIEDYESRLTPEVREASLTPLMRKSLAKFVEKLKSEQKMT